MPRGQKSKLRARERRNKARSNASDPKDAQASTAKGEEPPSSLCPVSEGASTSTPVAGAQGNAEEASVASCADAVACCSISAEGIVSEEQKGASVSMAAPSIKNIPHDDLSMKVGMLMHFLLDKYKSKEPITKADMLKIITKKYRGQFSEMLKRASERLEMVFGLDLKESKSSGQSYTIVSKLQLSGEGASGGCGFPKNGLLMPLLGVIFLNGNAASEREIWEFLNILGIYEGQNHLIFGEPKKLITQDLVQEKYLEYRQVPDSDPPAYEFLWGPRAYAETTKMKVLEFLAKVNGTNPRAFRAHYEEALRDEQERAQAKAAARAAAKAAVRAITMAKANARSKMKFNTYYP